MSSRRRPQRVTPLEWLPQILPHHQAIIEHTLPDSEDDRLTLNRPYTMSQAALYERKLDAYGIRRALSRIPGAGEGLFATRDLPINHLIPYASRRDLIAPDALEARYPGDTIAPYAFTGQGGIYDPIDREAVGTIGKYANDGRPNRIPNNAALVENAHARQVYVALTRPVRRGEEILVDYTGGRGGEELYLPQVHSVSSDG